MTTKTVIGIGVAILAVAGIGAGIWLASRPKVLPGPAIQPGLSAPAPAAGVVSPAPQAIEEEPAGPVREFVVVGSSFKLSPSTITVKKGDTVRITFKSQGPLHNFVIDEFGVATGELGEEEEEEVEFVADKAGTFEYYCSIGNHRAQGMKGKLVVE